MKENAEWRDGLNVQQSVPEESKTSRETPAGYRRATASDPDVFIRDPSHYVSGERELHDHPVKRSPEIADDDDRRRSGAEFQDFMWNNMVPSSIRQRNPAVAQSRCVPSTERGTNTDFQDLEPPVVVRKIPTKVMEPTGNDQWQQRRVSCGMTRDPETEQHSGYHMMYERPESRKRLLTSTSRDIRDNGVATNTAGACDT